MPADPAAAPLRAITALRRAMGAEINTALADPAVVEVMVNADGRIWCERAGQGRYDTGRTLTAAAAETVIRLIASHIGETVTETRPLVAGTIPETGERFQGVVPPLSLGPVFSIRRRPAVIYSLADYVAAGILAAGHAAALRRAVCERHNILVAGGTGSGKTTLVNALLNEPAFADERVVIIEDTRELQCVAADRVELLTRRADPPVTIAELVRTTLRLRPDRIVIGEVRDGSALQMLNAWNTGHPGGLCTIHANSAHDALLRLEDLIGEVSVRIPVRTIASAVQLIAFIRRTPAGRAVETVARVTGHVDGQYRLETISG